MTLQRPLRVAMIGQKGYPPVQGGIEKHVAELAARLPGFGIEVEIYSRPHYSSAQGPADIPGVEILRRPSLATKHLDAISHSMIATADAVFRRPDVVHYHALGPGLLAAIPRCLRGIPTVVTAHGLDWQREKWGAFARAVLRLGEVAAVRFPNATIAVSRALAEHFRLQYGRTVDFIPNGIEPQEPLGPERIVRLGVPARYILFVGRLVPEKGCHLLLKAWDLLPAGLRAGRDLVIAGDAGFSSSYVHDLKESAGPGVRFLGFVHGPTLAELYSNAELLVLPSTLEGLSIALLEGMSFRRCCLVSDIPPNLEAGGGAALFFPSGEAGGLAQAMASLLGDPERLTRMGEMAYRRVVKEYSWPRITAQTAAVYRRITG